MTSGIITKQKGYSMNLMAFFNGFHFKNEFWTLILPLSSMAGDIASGLLYAWSCNTFKSKKMRSGLSKKAGEIMILVFGELFSIGMQLPPCIMAGLSAYIILMEIMSIAENLKKLGVQLPAFLMKMLNTVDETLKEEDIAQALKKVSDLEKEVSAIRNIESTKKNDA